MKYDAFQETYKSILSVVNEHEISRGHNREVSAYLCYLTFAILDEEAGSYIPFAPDEFMFNRLRLYANTSPSSILNNWHCPSIPDLDENPLFIAFIIFGDLLINHDARKDYQSASLVLQGITSVSSFAIDMLQKVLPITNAYIEILISIRESCKYKSDVDLRVASANSININEIFRYDYAGIKAKRRKQRKRAIASLIFIIVATIIFYFAYSLKQ